MTKRVFMLEINELFYLTRSWTMEFTTLDGTLLEEQLHIGGPLLCISTDSETPVRWVPGVLVDNGQYVVAVADERRINQLRAYEDIRRVEQLTTHLVGLTEKVIQSNLPQEIIDILQRTPNTLASISGHIQQGVNLALDKLGKGK